MDLSELGRTRPATATPQTCPPLDPIEMQERLQGLLAQVGAEIAGPLTAAIERITVLSSTGRIGAESLRDLRDEVEAARQAGMIGQQLTRFASGRIRQSHEVIQLGETVGNVLANRQRETQARGITLAPSLAAVDVVVDASLLFSLLNSTVDWAIANAASAIEFSVDAAEAAARVRVGCRFRQRPLDESIDGPHPTVPRSLDSLTWRLIEQTAWTMGLRVDRSQDAGMSCVWFEFARAALAAAETDDAFETPQGFASSANSQPLAGSHVLVIASRREMRMLIRESLKHMSLLVDFVNSVEEATTFCREGLPHAIIIEAIQSGERFARFRDGIRAEVPGFVFVEIVEEGKTFEMSGPHGQPVARVGRDVLADSLPSALMFELSKGM